MTSRSQPWARLLAKLLSEYLMGPPVIPGGTSCRGDPGPMPGRCMKTLPPAPGLSLLLVSGLLPAFAGAQSGILVGSRVTAKLLGDIIGGSVGAAWKDG